MSIAFLERSVWRSAASKLIRNKRPLAKEYPRSYRVADQIQRELASVIRREVKDPRVPANLTVADVRVSSDLSSARVYVSAFDIENPAETVEVLNGASGFLRSRLGSTIRLRSVPTLKFFYDEVQEQGARLSSLIDDAVSTNTTSADSSTSDGDKTG